MTTLTTTIETIPAFLSGLKVQIEDHRGTESERRTMRFLLADAKSAIVLAAQGNARSLPGAFSAPGLWAFIDEVYIATDQIETLLMAHFYIAD